MTGDVLHPFPPTLHPPQATEILTVFQVRKTARWHFGFRHQDLTHQCHPRKTRYSTQTHIHAHTHTPMTSVSRSRLSELKPGRATWVVVTLYLITFSQAVFKCCSGSANQSQNLSEIYSRCTLQRSGLTSTLLYMKMNPSLTSPFVLICALWRRAETGFHLQSEDTSGEGRHSGWDQHGRCLRVQTWLKVFG